MSAYDRAYGLAEAIRDSDEYKEYIRHRDAIQASEGAMGLLRDFRRAEVQVQGARFLGQEPPAKAVTDLKRISDFIEMHRPIQDYLQAEYRYAVLVNDIQKILAEATEVWLDLGLDSDDQEGEDEEGKDKEEPDQKEQA